jgi:hypothetical protein
MASNRRKSASKHLILIIRQHAAMIGFKAPECYKKNRVSMTNAILMCRKLYPASLTSKGAG